MGIQVLCDFYFECLVVEYRQEIRADISGTIREQLAQTSHYTTQIDKAEESSWRGFGALLLQ